MKKSANYEINPIDKTITLTKKFLKGASTMGTPEYKELKKLEKEFEKVEESLTEEELVKYGLKPAEPESADGQGGASSADVSGQESSGADNAAAASVIDLISKRK